MVIVILFKETLQLVSKHRYISEFRFSPGEKPGREKTVDIRVAFASEDRCEQNVDTV